MILHVRIVFGAWVHVSPGTDFPFSLRIDEQLFGILFLIAVVSGPLWFFVICFRRFRLSAREHIVQFMVYCIGAGLLDFSPCYDLTGLAGRLFYW